MELRWIHPVEMKRGRMEGWKIGRMEKMKRKNRLQAGERPEASDRKFQNKRLTGTWHESFVIRETNGVYEIIDAPPD